LRAKILRSRQCIAAFSPATGPKLCYIKNLSSTPLSHAKEAQMAFMQRIQSLRQRHASIDHILHEEEIRPAPDIVRLHALKRMKLNLKDEMARLANGHEEAA
jgi:hypothetical protein